MTPFGAYGIGLANLTYDLCRFVQLVRFNRVPITTCPG
jgi:hypothetical protein